MITLQSPFLRLQYDPLPGAWSLASEEGDSITLRGAHMGIAFRAGRKRICWVAAGTTSEAAPAVRRDSKHGRFRVMAIHAEADCGLTVRIEWRLSLEKPFLLWRVVLHNRNDDPLNIGWIDLCRTGRRFGIAGGLDLPITPAERGTFVNGWQSWSFAGGRKSGDRQPGPMLGPYNLPMHIGTGLRSSGRPGHFVSDMFASIGRSLGSDLLVAGFLSQCEQFGAVETWLGDETLSLRMRADCDDVRLENGGTLATDWAYLALGSKASAAQYFDAAARENGARTGRAAPEGWCSWYYYHTAISQSDLEKNIDAARTLRPRLPLRMIQLDDGYAADVGDWFDRSPKFPSDMGEISARIREAGFTPGLWLSPFIVRPGSRVFREHPEWLAGGAKGIMSNVKISGLRDTLTLDVTRPDVVDHLRRLVRTVVKEWKFPFLKLDYLYLPAARNVRLCDPAVTRARALRRALEIIREEAGEKTYLLGCGCPLGSGIGIFDAMRIGADVDPVWKPHVFRRTWAARADPTVPAAGNAVRNMLARAPLHRRWWWNDPDCLLARDAETDLSADERRTLAAAIALSGGTVMLSDDLSALSPESVRLAQILFPPVYRAAELPAWRGEAPPRLAILPMRGPQGSWWVVGLFNWTDRPTLNSLKLGDWIHWKGDAIAHSFWDGRIVELCGGILEPLETPAHGSILLAVRPRGEGAQYVGSDLHFSQGAELAEWKLTRNGLRMRMHLGRESEGNIWLLLPGRPVKSTFDGELIQPVHISEGMWKFPVRFADEGEMVIKWKVH